MDPKRLTQLAVPAGIVLIVVMLVVPLPAIMLDLLFVRPKFTWPGLILVLTGIPVYFLWRLRGARAT